MVINRVIRKFFVRFQQIFGGKRYKLINFAPKKQIVDNSMTALTVSHIVSTPCVDNHSPRVDNQIGKKTGKKFFTYSHTIILKILFLKKRKRKE